MDTSEYRKTVAFFVDINLFSRLGYVFFANILIYFNVIEDNIKFNNN